MELANLQAFIAVAQQSSFSLAAVALHLTQPAISKRIAALEHNTGNRLFDRIGRQVTLTEAGETLLPYALRILGELEDSRHQLANLAGEIAGPLRIGTSHHIGLHRLPPVLRQFGQSYPKAQLDLSFQDSELVLEAVAHGELVLGIITLPPITTPPCTALPIWADPLHLVCGKSHQLTQGSCSAERLSNSPAILPEQGTFTRDAVEAALMERGVTVDVSFSTNYLETIKMMVKVGLGWSALPATMLDDDLCCLEAAQPLLERTLGVVRHRDRTLPNAARALLDLLPTANSF